MKTSAKKLSQQYPSPRFDSKAAITRAAPKQQSSLRVVRKPAMARKSASLNVYLVADQITDTRSCIKTTDLCHIETLQIPGYQRAQLFVVKRNSRLPKYAHLFANYVEDTGVLGKNQSSGCVIILESDSARWLLSFGTGFHLISKETIVADFGLRTAANLVDPNEGIGLRCLDSACLTRKAAQVREQATHSSPLEEFSIDTSTDLLRALTVNPLDDRFGLRAHGNDSLKVQVKTDLAGLSPLLADLLCAYQSDAYQRSPLAFIDHFRPVKKSQLIAELDAKLLADIVSGQHARIHFAPPSILDWERVSGFKYRASRKAPMHVELQLADLLKTMDLATLTPERLRKLSIRCVDDAHELIMTFPAWQGLQVDIDHFGEKYVLFDGNWYRINEDFVDEVESFIKTVPFHSKPLPDYDDKSEGEYNERLAKASNGKLELLDKKCIKIPGAATTVETCDLLRDGRVLIHVKRGTNSSSLSHLFSQGVVSADMMLNSADFRVKLKTISHSIQGISDSGQIPDPRDYEVVYAIVDHTQRSTLELPFFSKVSLRVAVQRLKGMGYKVSLLRINVASNRCKLSLYVS
ncbi:TIGR04141 family sporadically distributed protein [Granulosicoccus sp.]|nr:TIGR04141 family sporadically distributed protein [Granulosicoccus sp.]